MFNKCCPRVKGDALFSRILAVSASYVDSMSQGDAMARTNRSAENFFNHVVVSEPPSVNRSQIDGTKLNKSKGIE